MPSVSDLLHPREQTTTAPGSVLDFMRLLWAMAHELERMSSRMETELGVTARQRLVIRLVGRYPGISAGALAESLHLDPSSLTPVLDRLVRRELVERRDDPLDGRRTLYGLTAKGRELDVPTEHTAEDCVDRALTGLGASKIAAAREVLVAITEQLREDAGAR